MAYSFLMIINDFNVMRFTCLPSKTKTPLLIDAEAPLPGPIAF
jgi:hypothetical protein